MLLMTGMGRPCLGWRTTPTFLSAGGRRVLSGPLCAPPRHALPALRQGRAPLPPPMPLMFADAAAPPRRALPCWLGSAAGLVSLNVVPHHRARRSWAGARAGAGTCWASTCTRWWTPGWRAAERLEGGRPAGCTLEFLGTAGPTTASVHGAFPFHCMLHSNPVDCPLLCAFLFCSRLGVLAFCNYDRSAHMPRVAGSCACQHARGLLQRRRVRILYKGSNAVRDARQAAAPTGGRLAAHPSDGCGAAGASHACLLASAAQQPHLRVFVEVAVRVVLGGVVVGRSNQRARLFGKRARQGQHGGWGCVGEAGGQAGFWRWGRRWKA